MRVTTMKKIILILIFPCFSLAQNPLPTQDSLPSETLSSNPESLIESYRQRVIKGERMSEIARLYSQDPGSAKKGGLYQNVVRGMMVEEFETVAFSLKPGEISEVFETTYGFHFIQLIAIKGEALDLMHVLIKHK